MGNWMVIWWQVVSEILTPKLSKFDNLFSSDNRKCRDVFGTQSKLATCTGPKEGQTKNQDAKISSLSTVQKSREIKRSRWGRRFWRLRGTGLLEPLIVHQHVVAAKSDVDSMQRWPTRWSQSACVDERETRRHAVDIHCILAVYTVSIASAASFLIRYQLYCSTASAVNLSPVLYRWVASNCAQKVPFSWEKN